MICEILIKFTDNLNRTNSKNGDMKLNTAVNRLSSRVKYLESLLRDVVQIGTSLKRHAGTDANFLRLAEKLSSLDVSEIEKTVS